MLKNIYRYVAVLEVIWILETVELFGSFELSNREGVARLFEKRHNRPIAKEREISWAREKNE